MKIKNSISTAIILATFGLLNPFIPELTPTRLMAALREYDVDPLDNERPKKPYTIKEVCDLFRISRQTLYNLKKKGQISFLKIGTVTRISVDEVERLLSNNQEHNQV